MKTIRDDAKKTKICITCHKEFWSPYLQTKRCMDCKMKDTKS